LPALAVLLLVISSSGVRVGAQPPVVVVPPEVQARADTGERVRIIIGVRAAFSPEGALSGDAVADQHARIRVAQDAVLGRVAAYGVTAVTQFETIPFVSLTTNRQGLAALAADPGVAAIEPDELARASLAESVPRIQGSVMQSYGFRGTGTAVAILDTGVEASHPFLGGRVNWEACYSNSGGGAGGTAVCPGGFTSSTAPGSGVNCAWDSLGCYHGTHVAGIAGGASGVAPDTRIAAIQVFTRFDDATNCDGTPPCLLTTTTDQILGLQRVLALRNSGVPLVSANMSLGGGRYYAYCDATQTARKAAIDNLRSAGVATVISSGNEGYPDSIGVPACISSAVSVGSTTDADGVSSFSNRAPFLSLMAPGSDIISSVPGGGYRSLNGTSMAAPHVTGAWALIKQAIPSAAVSQVVAALQATGVPINADQRVYPRIRILQGGLAIAYPSTVVPGPPMNLSASVSGATVNLWWSPPNAGGPVSSYFIDVGTAPGASNVASGLNVGNTLAVSGSLSPGTYYIRVRAWNGNGAGLPSNEVAVTIVGVTAPGPPVGLAASVVGSTVTLSWGAPVTGGPASDYLVDAGTGPGLSNIVSGLPVGNTLGVYGTLPNGVYFARVRARNSAGTGPFSNEVSFAIGATARPGPPTSLVGSVLGGAVNFAWQAPTTGGAPTGYRIEAGSATGLSNLAILDIGNVTSFSTPAPTGVYFVRVRAFNAMGFSDPSNEVVVLPSQNTCTGDFSATLTWNTGSASGTPTRVDMDLHVREPDGIHVYYGSPTGHTARLDRDNTLGFGPENICTNTGVAEAGTYSVYVVAYSGNQWPTTATITVRSHVGTPGERYQTFTRVFNGSDSSLAQNVATVSFPSGAITEAGGTRLPDPEGVMVKEEPK